MDKDSLLDLLNVKPKEIKTTLTQTKQKQPTGEDSSPVSSYALQLDAFDRAQGGKLLRHNHHLRETQLEPEPVSDFFSSLFLTSPQTVEKCIDDRRLEFMIKTLESPEYLALHRSCELNPVASELATVELAKSFAKLREEDKKREDKRKEAQDKGRPLNEEREAVKDEIACMKAVCSALKDAGKEVDDYEGVMSALGCGPGQGNYNKLEVGKVANIFQSVKDNPQLRGIFDKAGRCRRFAQGQQRKKIHHGMDDMVGVVLDGDVGRLLPSELVKLVLPEFELDVMRRLTERQCMCRQYRGVEKIGRGPIVVVIDESSSMSGEPIEWAKAIALSLAYIAKHQKRWCCLCGYSGGTEGTYIVLPPGKWDEAELMKWLAHNFGGGTTLDVPVDVLPNVWWHLFVKQGLKRGKTDLLIVTDALVNLPKHLEEGFLRWKQAEQVKCTSIILQQPPGDLAKISDEVFSIPRLDLEQDAVQKILSL